MRKGNLLLVLLTFANLANGQPYGEILYSHNAGSKLSSGALMTQSVGVLLAGHLDSCAVNGKNFWIDRTDAGGDINGSTWSFKEPTKSAGIIVRARVEVEVFTVVVP